MPELRESVLAYIRELKLFAPGDRVGVAVSGGADSVALLRVLLELRDGLGIVLSVVHLNHRIRGRSAMADAAFVAKLAKRYSLTLHSGAEDVPAYAQAHRLGLEDAARKLRYGFFVQLARQGAFDTLATSHNQNDQAETLLMKLIRGSGTRGLAGIYPQKQMGKLTIVRPLLGLRRDDITEYLHTLKQPWREDRTNRDVSMLRNRVRAELLPLLAQAYSPGIVGLLAHTAEVSRVEEQFWDARVAQLIREVARQLPDGAMALEIEALGKLHPAEQRRLLRALLEQLGAYAGYKRVSKALALLNAFAGTVSDELGGGYRARRTARELRIEKARPTKQAHYAYALTLPGEVEVREINTKIRASLVPLGKRSKAYNQAEYLDPLALGSELVVRNWRPGDRFWPARTKSPKKVKTLLQERRIFLPERASWPVLTCGDEIVWMRGFFPAASHLANGHGEKGVLIEELPLTEAQPGK